MKIWKITISLEIGVWEAEDECILVGWCNMVGASWFTEGK